MNLPVFILEGIGVTGNVKAGENKGDLEAVAETTNRWLTNFSYQQLHFQIS
jgi:hypothetical protein